MTYDDDALDYATTTAEFSNCNILHKGSVLQFIYMFVFFHREMVFIEEVRVYDTAASA